MNLEKHALQLIERVYEAAIEPDTWATFVVELSEAFGGAAVALSIQRPGNPHLSAAQLGIYRTGLLDEFSAVFLRHYQRGLPWGDVIGDKVLP